MCWVPFEHILWTRAAGWELHPAVHKGWVCAEKQVYVCTHRPFEETQRKEGAGLLPSIWDLSTEDQSSVPC